MNKGEIVRTKRQNTFNQFDTEKECEEYLKKEVSTCEILKQLDDFHKLIKEVFKDN